MAGHCCIYSKCQSTLVALGADHLTLSRFNVLNPDDVKGSTAVLNPNEPDYTQIKLSWIWQNTTQWLNFQHTTEFNHLQNANTNAGTNAGVVNNFIECGYNSFQSLNIFIIH